MLKNRCLMLDLARVMERKEYYDRLLPWLAEWGYNTLHLHLTDDQGCQLVFPRRPELASKGAYTLEEMQQFIRKADSLGIEVIPEIESLGHAGFITRLAKYSHLGSDSSGYYVMNALDPENLETRSILEDLIKDTAEIFPSPILHVGLDEVDFSKLPRYKDLPKEEHWKIFADHAVWVHQLVREQGKRPAMWGDHILSTPQMADKFQKDVLIGDWHYEAEPKPETMDFFLEKGFEVWGVPSTMCWAGRVVSNSFNLANVRDFTGYALFRKARGVTGLINAVWCPWRYLPGAMDWPIAWAGQVFSQEKEDPAFCQGFCGSFYGLSASQARQAAEAFNLLHEAAPNHFLYEKVLLGSDFTQKHRRSDFTREHRRQCEIRLPAFTTAAGKLAAILPKAKQNADRLEDVVLSARLLARWAQYGAADRKPSKMSKEPSLREDCMRRWKQGRYAMSYLPKHENVLYAARKLS